MKYATRTEFVINTIARYSTSSIEKILDIGFVGEHARPFIHEALIENYPQTLITGIDTNPEIEKFSDSEFRKYHQISIFDIEEKQDLLEVMDVVVMCEVFEHLPHPYLSLHKIKACLKKGGLLVMTYPNPLRFNLFKLYLRQKNILDKNFLKIFRGAPDHKVFPMPPCMAAYLEDIGFEVKEICFPKAKYQGIPFLEKFGAYVGVVAENKL